jgi:hypothetical protein
MRLNARAFVCNLCAMRRSTLMKKVNCVCFLLFVKHGDRAKCRGMLCVSKCRPGNLFPCVSLITIV